jgi:pimeloyl-ACP methyl ester carboxylesterase
MGSVNPTGKDRAGPHPASSAPLTPPVKAGPSSLLRPSLARGLMVRTRALASGRNIAVKRLSRWSRAGIGAGIAVVSLVGTTACAAEPESSAAAAATSKVTDTAPQVPDIAWSSCPADQPQLTGYRCATIPVPLNYADPDGRKISLGLVEHPAATSRTSAGTLFFNPGGPDQLGSQYLPALLSGFGSQVVGNFNIISWDPRGAGGLSTPTVQCFDSAAEEAALVAPVDFPPLSRDQQTKWAGLHAQLNQHCSGRDDALLAHVSTADSARDLDLMRQALGESKLSYYGISYGTLLGATYANLFPSRVAKMVLDGNIYPPTWFSSSPLSSFLRIGSDKATAGTLDSFLSLCGKATTKQCAFSAGTPAATRQKFSTLLTRAQKSPIVTGSGSAQASASESDIVNLTDAALAIVTAEPAIGVGGWTGLASNLQTLWTASSGGTTTTAVTAPPASSAEQKLSVICGESPNPGTVAGSIQQADVSARRAGTGAQTWAWTAYCVNWPVKAASAYRGPWNRSTSPVLVVGNTGDPATAYQNSVLTSRLLPGARLITVQGYGHTELANPSTCAQNDIASYLTNGVLPKAGATCQQDAVPFP